MIGQMDHPKGSGKYITIDALAARWQCTPEVIANYFVCSGDLHAYVGDYEVDVDLDNPDGIYIYPDNEDDYPAVANGANSQWAQDPKGGRQKSNSLPPSTRFYVPEVIELESNFRDAPDDDLVNAPSRGVVPGGLSVEEKSKALDEHLEREDEDRERLHREATSIPSQATPRGLSDSQLQAVLRRESEQESQSASATREEDAGDVRRNPQEAGRRGGSQPKYQGGLQEAVNRIVSDLRDDEIRATLGAFRRWFEQRGAIVQLPIVNWKPWSFDPPIPSCDDLYIDGQKLVWKDRDGHERDRSLRTMESYIARART